MRASVFGAVALLVASLSTGCSSSHHAQPIAHLRSYFTAIASNSAAGSRAGLVDATPNSAAYRYLQFFAFSADANDDGGRPGVPARVGEVSARQVKLCDGPQCGTFSQIALDGLGRVTDFAVEGVPFSSRLVIGTGRSHVAAGGGTLTLLASYQAGTPGNEHVVLKITAGGQPLKVVPDKAAFHYAGDFEASPIFSVGKTSLAPNQSGTILWSFPIDADRGTAVISGCSGSPCMPWTASVPI